MPDSLSTTFTGTILSLGNGGVGKTSLALSLASDLTRPEGVYKTKNLEFEFGLDELTFAGKTCRVSQQYFIPPGQRDSEGDVHSRSFEQVMKIYLDIIMIPSVILLVYDLTQLESFNDLEFWCEKAACLAGPRTEVLLVGTHLESSTGQAVDTGMITNGCRFIEQSLRDLIPEWHGTCQNMEVSNITGAQMMSLKRAISLAILRGKGITPSIPTDAKTTLFSLEALER
jgi:hypothetical protein